MDLEYHATNVGVGSSNLSRRANFLEFQMANVKQGNLSKSPQWWKHLKDFKRVFWKTERKAQQKDIKERLYE